MKINVLLIISDHLHTLRRFPSPRISLIDLLVFYAVPIALALMGYIKCFAVTPDFYNVSVTFFGIFLALLLNMQVAIFGIFLRKRDVLSDPVSVVSAEEKLDQRRLLLGEVNSNISYLVLVSCLSLAVCLIAYTRSLVAGAAPAITVFIYSHFLLTLLMVVKRVHVLFKKEYE